MDERLVIPYPVIVEGRYDQLRLESVISAQILTTDGFGLFRKQEKMALFRALAEKTPLIVLTDSDGAGKVIRSHITSAVPPGRLIQLYIPNIPGVEKRKDKPSAEGTLGVEGMERELLRNLFLPYAGGQAVTEMTANPLSKTDFYLDGLTGGADSARRRDAFAQKLGLPSGMTPNALLAAVRVLCGYDEYLKLVGRENKTQVR